MFFLFSNESICIEVSRELVGDRVEIVEVMFQDRAALDAFLAK